MDKEKRFWKVSKRCPFCNRKLVTDNKKIFCQKCKREWYSLYDLEKENKNE